MNEKQESTLSIIAALFVLFTGTSPYSRCNGSACLQTIGL
jgi:hypothetical protein